MHAEMAQLKTRAKEQTHSQKGSVLVEFALILPVFVTVFIVGSSLYFGLYSKTVLNMATREGARAGALYGTSDRENKADKAALAACEGLLISFGPGEPVVVVKSTISGNILTVKASLMYIPLRFDWDYIFPESLTISAETRMRLEE